MDFVLNSSDSEYIDSPRVLKTRPNSGRGDLSRSTSVAEKVPSGVKIENGRLYLSDSRRTAITRSELQAVYDKLDTPRASPMHALRISGEGGVQLGSNNTLETLASKGKSSFDASKERMKLANIIDSETNLDDTTDSLFLRPITMQGPLEHTPKRPTSGLGNSRSASKRSYSHGLDSSEARFSDFSDAEDLLAEFTKPSSLTRTEAQKPPRFTPDNSELSPGRLLHVDSTSEHSTPRYQNIRDELDQSRTRFRQSINALLNSSPIGVGGMERSRTSTITDLVKVGSRLGEQVISDMAAVKKASEPRPIVQSLIDPSNHEKVDVKTLSNGGPEPRRMALEELKQLKVTEEDPFSPKEAKSKFGSSSKRVEPITKRLFKRVFWALLILLLFIMMDLALQIMVSRQDAGLSTISLDPLFEFLSEQWQDWVWWLDSMVGGGSYPAPIPH